MEGALVGSLSDAVMIAGASSSEDTVHSHTPHHQEDLACQVTTGSAKDHHRCTVRTLPKELQA